MTARNDFDLLAERARRAPWRTWVPARLSPTVEAHYRRDVTERAAMLGIAERDLFDHVARRERPT